MVVCVNTCLLIIMELCQVCKDRVWKYRCPACAVRTCSVSCVKEHKERSKCTGKRCKTAFVSLSEFSDSQLFSDYYFLEDVGRHGDSTKRDREMNTIESRGQKLNFHWLKSRASERGLTLLLQPPGMSLHRMNTSRTVSGKQRRKWTIEWRVHLMFPHCGVDYQEKHVPESTVICELLKKYLHSDPIAKHRLRLYVERGGIDAVSVLMRAERTTGKGVRYHVLDKDKTLCDNLKNKAIIEFPTLTVVLTTELTQYTLIGLKSETVASMDSISEQSEEQFICATRDIEQRHSIEQRRSIEQSEEQFICATRDIEQRHSIEQRRSIEQGHSIEQRRSIEQGHSIERRDTSDWSEDEQDCNSLQLIARMYSGDN